MRKIIMIALFAVVVSGCSFYQSVTNLSQMKFKLKSVSGFKVANIKIDNKSKFRDFNTIELLKLTTQVTKGRLPSSFILNVKAVNPNKNIEESGGSVTVKSFPWKLFIDNKKVVEGNIAKPLEIFTGGNTIIPVDIRFDLLELFSADNIENIVNLALSIGGKEGSTSRLMLKAKPVIDTPLGAIQYPDEIEIVDYKFN